MPHINIMISKPLDNDTRNDLQNKIADSMELIPGKNAGNTLICISDNYSMYRDKKPLEAIYIDIRLYKESPDENKKEFAERMFVIVESVLGIPPANMQINFVELPCWASNGGFF